MNGVVIYKGKYGATARYAKWIGEMLNLPVLETDDIAGNQLSQYDYVILGGSVYMGRMLMKQWIKDHLKILWAKKVFLFVVSGTPPDKRAKLDSYVTASVPAEAVNRFDVYFLPGRLVIKKLSWADNLILRIGAFFAGSKEQKKQMLTDYDDVSKDKIESLLAAVNNYLKLKQTG